MVLSADTAFATVPYSRQQAILTMDALGANGTPFFFMISFDQQLCYIMKNEESEILFDINGKVNFDGNDAGPQCLEALQLSVYPESLVQYTQKFDHVRHQIAIGNSFLVNLTCRTPIEINWPLDAVFHAARAKYKVSVPDTLVCFSPEPFVTICDGIISSYPMKGTIDAKIPNAAQKVLEDAKEMAEHVTIVDLIRNDLSQVASNVHVARFRYLEEVVSLHRHLLQVSSEVRGILAEGYQQHIGSLLFKLLPAGSISGAPKAKTLEIIMEAEKSERGFFTGICGYFDGKNLDSGVMIRFIEKEGDKYFFRSGGGITYSSQADKEYDEMIKKIYVPVY